MSLSALPGVDWARFTPTADSGAARYGGGGGGMDLLTGDGAPTGCYTQPGQRRQHQLQSLATYGSGGGSGLPVASAEAMSRHSLLPMPEQRQRQAHGLPQSQRPLYPEFDATPARRVQYGFSRSAGGASASAPPLESHLQGLDVSLEQNPQSPKPWLVAPDSGKTHARLGCARCKKNPRTLGTPQENRVRSA